MSHSMLLDECIHLLSGIYIQGRASVLGWDVDFYVALCFVWSLMMCWVEFVVDMCCTLI